MEAPSVSFLTTKDDYKIAYTSCGEGPALVFMPPAFFSIDYGLNPVSVTAAWLEALASRFEVILFDGRGQGLSTRDLPMSLTMADLGRDLAEVLEHVTAQSVILAAHGGTSHAAVRYAAVHPERVAGLVMVCCSASNRAWPNSLWRTLASEDWDNFLVSSGGVSHSRGELELWRRVINQGDWIARMNACMDSDISDILPVLDTPLLVMHARDYVGLPISESVKLAELARNAEMVVVDGATAYGDPQQSVTAIEHFAAVLAQSHQSESPRSAPVSKGLSPRETEVLCLIARGRSNQQIADELVISVRTVERHVTNIYGKIGAQGRADATTYALRCGLVDSNSSQGT